MALSAASKLRLKSYGLLGSSAVATMLSLAYLFGGLASLGPVMDDEASLKQVRSVSCLWSRRLTGKLTLRRRAAARSQLVRLLAADQHYKFLIPLLVPVGS
jgi:hypothetical protein